MKNRGMASRLLIGASFVSAVALSGPASAGPKLFAFANSSITFNGTVEANAAGNTDPFLIEVFSAGNECLRFAVSTQGSDLEARLTAPNGAHWRDDDGGGSLRPLIKAITPQRGWYVLSVSTFNGAPIGTVDFTATMHRLPTTHPACSGATSPTITFAPLSRKAAATMAPMTGGTSR